MSRLVKSVLWCALVLAGVQSAVAQTPADEPGTLLWVRYQERVEADRIGEEAIPLFEWMPRPTPHLNKTAESVLKIHV